VCFRTHRGCRLLKDQPWRLPPCGLADGSRRYALCSRLTPFAWLENVLRRRRIGSCSTTSWAGRAKEVLRQNPLECTSAGLHLGLQTRWSADLGTTVSTTNITCSANATAVYACLNGGGTHPKAANKETVNGPPGQRRRRLPGTERPDDRKHQRGTTGRRGLFVPQRAAPRPRLGLLRRRNPDRRGRGHGNSNAEPRLQNVLQRLGLRSPRLEPS